MAQHRDRCSEPCFDQTVTARIGLVLDTRELCTCFKYRCSNAGKLTGYARHRVTIHYQSNEDVATPSWSRRLTTPQSSSQGGNLRRASSSASRSCQCQQRANKEPTKRVDPCDGSEVLTSWLPCVGRRQVVVSLSFTSAISLLPPSHTSNHLSSLRDRCTDSQAMDVCLPPCPSLLPLTSSHRRPHSISKLPPVG